MTRCRQARADLTKNIQESLTASPTQSIPSKSVLKHLPIVSNRQKLKILLIQKVFTWHYRDITTEMAIYHGLSPILAVIPKPMPKSFLT